MHLKCDSEVLILSNEVVMSYQVPIQNEFKHQLRSLEWSFFSWNSKPVKTTLHWIIISYVVSRDATINWWLAHYSNGAIQVVRLDSINNLSHSKRHCHGTTTICIFNITHTRQNKRTSRTSRNGFWLDRKYSRKLEPLDQLQLHIFSRFLLASFSADFLSSAVFSLAFSA